MTRIALTGSIGMGKSTTAAMFADRGVSVWDADAAVRRAYRAGGPAVEPMSRLVPEAIVDGAVGKDALRGLIAVDRSLLPKVEAIIHPLVAEDREAFTRERTEAGETVLIYDIPLLFETGGEVGFDKVIVASAPADEQKRRVLGRGSMTEEDFALILARQMPDREKRLRADWVVNTTGLETAKRSVDRILAEVGYGA